MPQPPSGSAEGAGSFAERLRALRATAGLTQEELAERAGLSTNGVSALERGTRTSPYPHTVRALAEALGADAATRDELLKLARGSRPEPSEETPTAEPHRPTPAIALGTPATPLLGREQDVAELLDLLADAGDRLVTLTGPGGVGKTRLAGEVAARLMARGAFTDGVALVALATVPDAGDVAAAIADALSVPESPDSPMTAVAGHLRGRHMLLVLDNFEHVLAATGVVVDLLAACPMLSVLATSRAPLQVRGEVEWPVRPLPLPATRAATPDLVTAAPAGRLFVERAKAAAPEFEVTDANAAEVAAICWRLGGLPLAIELAAPKVRHLDPATLLLRLDQALAVGWARDLPARQRTIQATLDWSHALLEEPEQRLFAPLGVLSGGFDLAAAEAVAADVVDAADVLTALEGLVTQSLVSVTRSSGGSASYSLLEPVRDYALRRLREQKGAEEAARRRHRAHFLAHAEQAAAQYAGPEQVQWLQRTEWESANIRAAIAHALSDGDGETAARLCWAMWIAWWMSGHLREGRTYATEALRHPLPPLVRVRAMLVRACMAYAQGDSDTAAAQWQEAHDAACAHEDHLGVAYGGAGLGLVDLAAGRLAEARNRLLAAVAEAETLGEEWLRSLCLIWIGTTLLGEGDPSAAMPHIERGLASARDRGDRLVAYVALFNLAEAALAMAEPERAEALLLEGTELSAQTADRANLAFYLDALAVIAVDRGDAERGARLFGAAEAMRRQSGAVVYRYYLPDEQRRAGAVERACAELGEACYRDLQAEGAALDLPGAVALAGQAGGGP